MLFTRIRKTWADSRGAAMIEAALVVPLLILIFASIGQFGFIFAVNSNMVDVCREASRRMAVGEFDTTQAEAFAATQLLYPLTYTVSATVAANGSGGNDVTVTVSAPMSEVAFLDIVGVFGDGNMSNTVTMREES